MKIFGHERNSSNSGEATLPIKQEAMFTRRKKYLEDEKTQNVKTGIKKKFTNPYDKEGNVMRCHEFDSKMQFASKCPHRQKGKGKSILSK